MNVTQGSFHFVARTLFIEVEIAMTSLPGFVIDLGESFWNQTQILALSAAWWRGKWNFYWLLEIQEDFREHSEDCHTNSSRKRNCMWYDDLFWLIAIQTTAVHSFRPITKARTAARNDIRISGTASYWLVLIPEIKPVKRVVLYQILVHKCYTSNATWQQRTNFMNQ